MALCSMNKQFSPSQLSIVVDNSRRRMKRRTKYDKLYGCSVDQSETINIDKSSPKSSSLCISSFENQLQEQKKFCYSPPSSLLLVPKRRRRMRKYQFEERNDNGDDNNSRFDTNDEEEKEEENDDDCDNDDSEITENGARHKKYNCYNFCDYVDDESVATLRVITPPSSPLSVSATEKSNVTNQNHNYCNDDICTNDKCKRDSTFTFEDDSISSSNDTTNSAGTIVISNCSGDFESSSKIIHDDDWNLSYLGNNGVINHTNNCFHRSSNELERKKRNYAFTSEEFETHVFSIIRKDRRKRNCALSGEEFCTIFIAENNDK